MKFQLHFNVGDPSNIANGVRFDLDFRNRGDLYGLLTEEIPRLCNCLRSLVVEDGPCERNAVNVTLFMCEHGGRNSFGKLFQFSTHNKQFGHWEAYPESFGDLATEFCNSFDAWADMQKRSAEEKARRFDKLLSAPDA